MKRLFILFLFFVLIFPFSVFAQFTTGSQVEVNVDMIPSIPGANQKVRVDLTSYSTEINAAKITWSVNGKIVDTGIGKKTFYFTTGDLNTETTLDVDVLTIEGSNIHNTYKIHPAEVDLLWQSESLTPPFYKGKSMFSHQNKITFVVFPHITDSEKQEIPAKNLIYKWKLNGSAVQESSGYGKNTFTMTGALISRPIEITVEVTSRDSSARAVSNITVFPIEPEMILYEKNPLYGIQFQKALTGTIEMKDSKEITVLGIPMFSGGLDPLNRDIKYTWSVNGSIINNNSNQNIQVFRKKDGAVGTARISLSTENISKILQSASGSFDLKFSSKNSSDQNQI